MQRLAGATPPASASARRNSSGSGLATPSSAEVSTAVDEPVQPGVAQHAVERDVPVGDDDEARAAGAAARASTAGTSAKARKRRPSSSAARTAAGSASRGGRGQRGPEHLGAAVAQVLERRRASRAMSWCAR